MDRNERLFGTFQVLRGQAGLAAPLWCGTRAASESDAGARCIAPLLQMKRSASADPDAYEPDSDEDSDVGRDAPRGGEQRAAALRRASVRSTGPRTHVRCARRRCDTAAQPRRAGLCSFNAHAPPRAPRPAAGRPLAAARLCPRPPLCRAACYRAKRARPARRTAASPHPPPQSSP